MLASTLQKQEQHQAQHAKFALQVNICQKKETVSAKNAMLVNIHQKQELPSVKIVLLTCTLQNLAARHVQTVQMDGMQ